MLRGRALPIVAAVAALCLTSVIAPTAAFAGTTTTDATSPALAAIPAPAAAGDLAASATAATLSNRADGSTPSDLTDSSGSIPAVVSGTPADLAAPGDPGHAGSGTVARDAADGGAVAAPEGDEAEGGSGTDGPASTPTGAPGDTSGGGEVVGSPETTGPTGAADPAGGGGGGSAAGGAGSPAGAVPGTTDDGEPGTADATAEAGGADGGTGAPSAGDGSAAPGIAIDPGRLPASEWAASTSPAPGEVLLQSDPAAIDYAVDVSWAPPTGVAPLGYRVELFSGRSVTNASSLIARAELDSGSMRYRVEGVGFGATTVTARVTLLDGAAALPNPLVSDSLSLPEASTGILASARAGVPTLADPTADGFTATWAPATGGPAPAGYVVRVLERRHDLAATSANSFITATFDAGPATAAVISSLAGSSRYLAAVAAYDLVDGVKRFRPSSATSTVPAWSSDFPAQTLGARAPLTEWAAPPAAPTAPSAHAVSWTGSPTAGRYTGGSSITGYRVELHQRGVGLVATAEVPISDPTDAPSTTFRGLASSADYSVRVAAVNAVGVGERSDFSPVVTTPATSTPGSRPPAYTDRAALDAAIAAGTVATATPGPTGTLSVEQGQDARVAIPWTTPQSGEAWWYGDGTFATVATSTSPGTDTDTDTGTGPGTSLALPTSHLPVGTHWLLFVTDDELDGGPAPTGGTATAIAVEITPLDSDVLPLENAVLRWGLNDEANNGAYFGGCNYLSAGRTPDPGGSVVFSETQYSARAGSVSIEKPDASGRFVPATWQTKCLDRAGAPLSSGTATPYGGNQFVITNGTGEVDRATGSARIRWTGDVTVAYYGGLTFWYLSDPVLTVENGSGTLTATVGGFGTDMDDMSKWQPLSDRTVTLATFSGVQVGPDGFTAQPDYRGVAVDLPAGQTAQSRGGADWGSFPQSFIDFQLETGAAAYWYSSGGQADAAKPAQPFVVGYDAATFAPPVAAPETAQKASAAIPTAKLPPLRVPPALAPFSAPVAASTALATTTASSVVIIESPASSALDDEVVLLLVALLALLALVVIVVGIGGGLVALGATTRRCAQN
jgi:hypothetical protein